MAFDDRLQAGWADLLFCLRVLRLLEIKMESQVADILAGISIKTFSKTVGKTTLRVSVVVFLYASLHPINHQSGAFKAFPRL